MPMVTWLYESPGQDKDPSLLTPGPGLFCTVLTVILGESVTIVLPIWGGGAVNGSWALRVLEQESVDFEILFCERFVPEMDGSLIKQILDYLITLALEYVGESQGDGQGKQKVRLRPHLQTLH